MKRSLKPSAILGAGLATLAVAVPLNAAPKGPLLDSGAFRLEAENYDEGGEGVGYHKSAKTKTSTAKVRGQEFRKDDLVSTTGGPNQGVAVNNWDKGDWLQYTFKVPQAGEYELRFTYSRAQPSDGKLELTVNGQDKVAEAVLPSTQYPWTYEQTTAVVKLQAGENKLRIGTSTGGLGLDAVDIVPSATFGNGGASWVLPRRGALRLEAENFDLTPGGAVGGKPPSSQDTFRQGAPVKLVAGPGNGAAVGEFAPGESLTYSVRAMNDGNYTLRVRHAGLASAIRLMVDGVNRSGEVKLPATNSPTDFRTTEVRIRSARGFHKLTLEAVAGSATIDWVELEKDPSVAAIKPDPNGKGSYASEPPEEAYDASRGLFHRVWDQGYQWINRPAGEPVPSNHWWTNIISNHSALTGNLWAYPQRVGVNADGVSVTGYSKMSERPGSVGVEGGQTMLLKPTDGSKLTHNALLSFGDWSVSFRVDQASDKSMDVTTARGMPMTWVEFKGIEPSLVVPGGATLSARGAALTGTVTADRLLVTPKDGLPMAIYAPEGTSFTLGKESPSGKEWKIQFAGDAKYLVLAVLPSPEAFGLFARHAYAVPQNTRYDYAYDPAAGTMTTNWKIEARALKAGASTEFIQGWLPHNYRDVVSTPKLLPDWQYPTLNGPVKLSVGNTFQIVQPAPSLALAWPTPRQIGGKADYDAARMGAYLDLYAANSVDEKVGGPKYGGETYFGMKPIQQYAECAVIAKQMGHKSYDTYLKNAEVALADWFTYTPGEKLHYFAAYPGTGALIGFNPSFGSENFTDNHFHYGYHIASAGAVSLLDPAWGKDYAAMATLVAKQYANWDRNDKRFPYFRCFEPWVGHSYAGGSGDPRGNNQESVSEAIQSWVGLVLLGEALGNKDMTAAGMMGYTTESKAALEYWFDAHRDLFPKKGFDRGSIAINYDDSKGYGTFFGANPEWVLGIIALPVWPGLDYESRYPDTTRFAVDSMLQQRTVFHKDPAANTWKSFEAKGSNVWMHINLGLVAHYDPQSVCEMYDDWKDSSPTLKSDQTTLYYWQAHAYRSNGQRDWTRRLSTPIGAAYYHAGTKRRVYEAFNPTDKPVTVQVSDVATGAVVDSFQAKPHELTLVESGK